MYYILYYALGIVLIPGLILGLIAQQKVISTFNKYNDVSAPSGRTAKDVARQMLDGAGLTDVKIKQIKGQLTDNFNPQTNTLSLSESTYNQSSVSALGVAAHEIGHVFQQKQGYVPLKLRNFLVPVINFSGFFVWPLIFIGLILEFTYVFVGAEVLIYIGIGLYGLNTIFCLVTLPVEKNASKKAYDMLVSTGELGDEEAKGVKKVLDAASLTYVAGLVTSILSLLRLILYVFAIRGDRN